MILKQLTYKFHFDGNESAEFKPCKEDVFYLHKGKKYKQFYAGQLIPLEVYNLLFSEPESTKSEVQEEETKEPKELVDKTSESEVKKVVVEETEKKKTTAVKKVKTTKKK